MNNRSSLIILVVAIAVAVLFWTARGRRSPVEKVEDDLRSAGRHVQDAVSPRTPAEKVRDGLKDTVRDIRN